MDTKVPTGESTDREAGTGGTHAAATQLHVRATTDTAGPKPNRENRIKRDLTWYNCQAVKFDKTGKNIIFRSFPFFALSPQHAAAELRGLKKEEGVTAFTHLHVFGLTIQKTGKKSTTKSTNELYTLDGEKA